MFRYLIAFVMVAMLTLSAQAGSAKAGLFFDLQIVNGVHVIVPHHAFQHHATAQFNAAVGFHNQVFFNGFFAPRFQPAPAFYQSSFFESQQIAPVLVPSATLAPCSVAGYTQFFLLSP